MEADSCQRKRRCRRLLAVPFERRVRESAVHCGHGAVGLGKTTFMLVVQINAGAVVGAATWGSAVIGWVQYDGDSRFNCHQQMTVELFGVVYRRLPSVHAHRCQILNPGVLGSISRHGEQANEGQQSARFHGESALATSSRKGLTTTTWQEWYVRGRVRRPIRGPGPHRDFGVVVDLTRLTWKSCWTTCRPTTTPWHSRTPTDVGASFDAHQSHQDALAPQRGGQRHVATER